MATVPTVGELYRANIVTEDTLSAAIEAYLADSSNPVALEIGDKRLDVAGAILAHQ